MAQLNKGENMFDLAPYAKQFLLIAIPAALLQNLVTALILIISFIVLICAETYALNKYFKLNSLQNSFNAIISAYLLSLIPAIGSFFLTNYFEFLTSSIAIGFIYNWLFSCAIDYFVIGWCIKKLNKQQLAMFVVVANFIFIAVAILLLMGIKYFFNV